MDRHSIETRPYWEALQEKRLVIQQCVQCGKFRHYPQPMCPACHSMEAGWHEIGGKGVVHSWTITHQTVIPGFAEQVPYVVATVDLPEGVRVAAPLRGVAHERLRIGLPVSLIFEKDGEGRWMPAFTASGADA